MRARLCTALMGASVGMAAATAADGAAVRAAEGPGWLFGGLSVSYDSPPFPVDRYRVTGTLSGEVCGDPATGTWTFTVSRSGYPNEVAPTTRSVSFRAANPLAIGGDQWLQGGLEIARFAFLVRLTPGTAPTITPAWTYVGDIENIVSSPAQVPLTATTLPDCPAASPPPPPGTVTGAPAPGFPPGRVKPPGERAFAPVSTGTALPPGTSVDVSNGAGIEISDGRGGELVVYGAKDSVPSRAVIVKAGGSTELRLTGGDFATCARRTLPAAGKPVRRLWAKGKGKFRTKGRLASAAGRGTWWLTQDYCARTLVRVREGSVLVTDLLVKKNVVVAAGTSYSARR